MDTLPTIDQLKSGLDPDTAGALVDHIDALEKDRDEHKAQREKAEGELEKAKAAPKRVTDKPAGPKALKLVAPKEPELLGAEDLAKKRAWIRDQIAHADDVEIAFSNGKTQIMSLGTRAITGDVWKDSLHGLQLSQHLDLHGAGNGGAQETVEGYALVLDGKAVAYTSLDTPVTVAPGAHVRLDHIYF